MQQVLADGLEPAVLPVAVRIPGGVVAQVVGRAEVHADRFQQRGDRRRPAPMHADDAHGTRTVE
jgi:hypothetical protein